MSQSRPVFQFRLMHLLALLLGVGAWLGVYRLGNPFDSLLVGASALAIGPTVWWWGRRAQSEALQFIGAMLTFAGPLIATIAVGLNILRYL